MWSKIGHQKNFKRFPIAFVGNGCHRLSVRKQQTQNAHAKQRQMQGRKPFPAQGPWRSVTAISATLQLQSNTSAACKPA
jgi:hypothetical protein